MKLRKSRNPLMRKIQLRKQKNRNLERDLKELFDKAKKKGALGEILKKRKKKRKRNRRGRS